MSEQSGNSGDAHGRTSIEAFVLELGRRPGESLRVLAKAMGGLAASIEQSERDAASAIAQRDREYQLRERAEMAKHEVDAQLLNALGQLKAQRSHVRRLQKELLQTKRAKGFKLAGPDPRDRRPKMITARKHK